MIAQAFMIKIIVIFILLVIIVRSIMEKHKKEVEPINQFLKTYRFAIGLLISLIIFIWFAFSGPGPTTREQPIIDRPTEGAMERNGRQI